MGDRLSNLPLSIIHEILARVPIKDAIRTCTLSKEWRYTWTTLPRLVFDCDNDDLDEIEEDGLMEEYMESTENFISNVLFHHKGPIHSFDMYIVVDVNIDSIEKWILCLSTKDIRELSIRMNYSTMKDVAKNLKSSLYSFVKLTKLSLRFVTFHPPPSSFKGFLALTTLDLYDIELSSDGVESLIACCPLLETLQMFACSCEELRIRSPNLKNLFLRSDKHVKLCLNAPLLAAMDIWLPGLPRTLAYNYTNFLGCFTNLVELKLHDFIKHLSTGIDSCQDTLVFQHLRVIEVLKVDLTDAKVLSAIVRLVSGAPNLHKLTIFFRPKSGPEAPFDIGCEPNFTLEKLKDVHFYRVCDHLFGMHFIKFLLERSPVLETVDLEMISKKAAAEVLGFHRSSTNARILVSIED